VAERRTLALARIPLERRLRELLPGKSWNELRRLVRTGKVFLDGAPVLDPVSLVPAKAQPELRLQAPRATRTPALARDAIRHVDTHLVVVEKPPGISTVPFDEHETFALSELVREALREGGRRAPLGIVHRIDKETSGLVVFARSMAAKLALKQQFRVHSVGRRYVALVHGRAETGALQSRLVKDRGDGRRGSTRNPKLGREATTHVRVLERLHGASFIECRLETGRTHQIRIHLSEAGHPLLGERVYSKSYPGRLLPAPRLMLHARELSFQHPLSGERLSFEQDLPGDMRQVLARLRGPRRP
jgi:23S rRNA pseudouridine1911/1915/1917 synthase